MKIGDKVKTIGGVTLKDAGELIIKDGRTGLIIGDKGMMWEIDFIDEGKVENILKTEPLKRINPKKKKRIIKLLSLASLRKKQYLRVRNSNINNQNLSSSTGNSVTVDFDAYGGNQISLKIKEESGQEWSSLTLKGHTVYPQW